MLQRAEVFIYLYALEHEHCPSCATQINLIREYITRIEQENERLIKSNYQLRVANKKLKGGRSK